MKAHDWLNGEPPTTILDRHLNQVRVWHSQIKKCEDVAFALKAQGRDASEVEEAEKMYKGYLLDSLRRAVADLEGD